jgi:hypothetical protein
VETGGRPVGSRCKNSTCDGQVHDLPSAVAAVAVAQALDDVAMRTRGRYFHDVRELGAGVRFAPPPAARAAARAAAGDDDGALDDEDPRDLIIVTGAGRHSPFGASVLRPMVLRMLARAEARTTHATDAANGTVWHARDRTTRDESCAAHDHC